MVRYERKYLVPYKMLDSLRARVNTFARPDIFAEETESDLPQYTVRSIYYDTRDLQFHQEKIEGVELRKKFRIRCYNNSEPGTVAVLEIKKKIQNRVQKHRAFVNWKNVPELLLTADIEKYMLPDNTGKNLEDASRFFFHMKKRNLMPTVLIVYEREAYHGLLDSGVRITFDKNIRSFSYPAINDMFRESNLRHLFRNHFIMEIKYFTDKMPQWAMSLVQEFRLRHEALSKYAIGFDVHTQNKIIH